MQPDSFPRLLGDVGATNARFAWQDAPGGPLLLPLSYRCSQFADFEAAVKRFCEDTGRSLARHLAIGIADPLTGDTVRMTNHDWSFSISEVKRRLGLDHFVVVNDFTALALALPLLTEQDLIQVCPGTGVKGAPLAVLGPGTGLGTSGLVFVPGVHDALPIALAAEGGHVTLSAFNQAEAQVLEQLRARFGHVSAERALSGSGLVNLYVACCALAQRSASELSPAQVVESALAQNDPQAVQALEFFFAFLGGVAGNLALTLGARGGVYLGAGIVPRVLPQLMKSLFFERFVGKGRCRPYLSAIPVYAIHSELSPALLGAGRALDSALAAATSAAASGALSGRRPA